MQDSRGGSNKVINCRREKPPAKQSRRLQLARFCTVLHKKSSLYTRIAQAQRLSRLSAAIIIRQTAMHSGHRLKKLLRSMGPARRKARQGRLKGSTLPLPPALKGSGLLAQLAGLRLQKAIERSAGQSASAGCGVPMPQNGSSPSAAPPRQAPAPNADRQ